MCRTSSHVRLAVDVAADLPPGGGDRLGERHGVPDHPDAQTASAAVRLDQHREAGHRLGVGEARQHRYVRLGHQRLRLGLAAQHAEGLGRRADPDHPGVDDRGRELGVLGEHPDAGVDRVGPGPLGRHDHQVAPQVRGPRRAAVQMHGVVGLGDVRRVGVGVGVDGDRLDADQPAGGEHPAGDLASVRHQKTSDHRSTFPGRKTPTCPAPSTTALCTADRQRPRTVRVSRGSMTPSSSAGVRRWPSRRVESVWPVAGRRPSAGGWSGIPRGCRGRPANGG